MTDTNPHASAVPTEMIDRAATAIKSCCGWTSGEGRYEVATAPNAFVAAQAALSAAGVPALVEENARLASRYKEALLALTWLVGLKDERPVDYAEQKPLAWAAARAVVRQAMEDNAVQPAASDAEGV